MFLAGRQLLSPRTGPASAITVVSGVKAVVSAFSTRRYSSSSSKPSNPADGARSLAQTSPPAKKRVSSGRRTAARQQMSSQLKQAGLNRSVSSAIPSLPFVRRTDHLKPVDISVASFFAQHRPVAITHAFPLTFDDGYFHAMLTSNKTSTSSAPIPETHDSAAYGSESGGVTESEVAVHSVRMPGGNALRIEISTINNDYTANDYIPYQPPPVPVPMENQSSSRFEPRRRTRKQVIAVISAFAPDSAADLLRDGLVSPAIVASRLRIQQRKREQERGFRITEEQMEEKEMTEDVEADTMQALSVKRQRRLKMKKHKLKKLMRKTRNLRRRLENR